MAATSSGAIKAYLESLAFGVPVFRDGPRPGQGIPYIVVTEGVSAGLDGSGNGDYGDPHAPLNIIELVTVDLVQQARVKASGGGTKSAERYGLAEAIAHALNHATLPAHPAKVTAVRVQDIDRIPIADNTVRHAIHIAIHRELLLSEVIPA
ncbi:hypothetical protein [Actinacidiphila sp. ITFR-21]|uniref:hypothetical protein n=1 Tax=Actinacidiphila sp. ITFR-21 TaxID=3075199 RepID=UPI00288BDB54|nr:hypothetical protein [Streptomyces sp. ITFR-21]WNI15574.1 hypothetical protein RLT57_08560 [Streptomyces sp. ITFR-21]